MQPLGINEALKFAPLGMGPRISVFLQGQPAGAGRPRESFLIHACRTAHDLIQGTYGRDLAASVESELRDGLTDLARTTRGKVGTFAYLWSQTEARPFKVAIEVPEQVVISASFHIKPFVEARELKQDFLLIADQGSRLEVYRVLPTKLIQVAIFHKRGRRGNAWMQPAVAAEIASVVRWTMTLAPIPILIAANGPVLRWLDEALHWIEVPKFALSTRQTVELGGDSLFATARGTMDPWFKHLRSEAVHHLTTDSSDSCLHGLEVIGSALASGSVASLFVADDRCIWGVFDGDSGLCERHPGQIDAYDGDILNSFTQFARGRGIPVHVVPAELLPNGSEAVAICKPRRQPSASARGIYTLNRSCAAA